ncbi:MAG: DUF6491 family protein [Pseudomonadota bacterium]
MLRALSAITAATFVLAGCASSGPRLDAADYLASPALGEQTDRICFTRNIDGFGATTRTTVLVEEGINDYYLVEVFGGCQDLDWAQSLAFTRTTGSCLTRGDRLLAFDSVFPSRSDARFSNQCTIKSIYEWDKNQLGEDGVTKIVEDDVTTEDDTAPDGTET